MRRILGFLIGVIAGVAALVSVWLATREPRLLVWAAVAHVVAALLAVLAASTARKGRLSGAERDVVFVSALFVPVFGPALAWTFPHPDHDREVEDAHDVFERYLEHVQPRAPTHERTLFTGERRYDLARELDVETYGRVLQSGPADQKRNALSRLTRLGGRAHLEKVRRCLEDPDHEVRLFAHSELDRVIGTHEGRLSALRASLREPGAPPSLRLELAEAHLALGGSGALDDAASRLHFRLGGQEARRAQSAGATAALCVLVEARSLCGQGDPERAQALLSALSQAAPDQNVALVQAEAAYHLRDFGAAREHVHRAAAAGEDLPAWAEALRLAGATA